MQRHLIRRAGPFAVAFLIATMLAPIAGAQSGGGSEKPTDSEIGVTADEIRIAVIADVENPAAPGLFQGSVDGVRGFAKYVNSKGGLAKRKVVVDFIDSKLSATRRATPSFERARTTSPWSGPPRCS